MTLTITDTDKSKIQGENRKICYREGWNVSELEKNTP